MVNVLQDNYSKHNPLLPILTIFWVHVQVQFIFSPWIFTLHCLSLLTTEGLCFSYKVGPDQAVYSAEQCPTHYKWIFTRNCDHLANNAVSPRPLFAVSISSARVSDFLLGRNIGAFLHPWPISGRFCSIGPVLACLSSKSYLSQYELLVSRYYLSTSSLPPFFSPSCNIHHNCRCYLRSVFTGYLPHYLQLTCRLHMRRRGAWSLLFDLTQTLHTSHRIVQTS